MRHNKLLYFILIFNVTYAETISPIIVKDEPIDLYGNSSVETIENTGQSSISDMLKDTSGVNISTGGYIRLGGLGAQHSSVLIDGVPVYDASGVYNYQQVQNLPTALISRLDIVKGGQGVRYGSGNIGGLMNIVIKDPGGESKGIGRLEGGTYDTVSGYAGFESGYINMVTGGNKTEGFPNAVGGENNNGYEDGYVILKAKYINGSNTFSGFFQGQNSFSYVNGYDYINNKPDDKPFLYSTRSKLGYVKWQNSSDIFDTTLTLNGTNIERGGRGDNPYNYTSTTQRGNIEFRDNLINVLLIGGTWQQDSIREPDYNTNGLLEPYKNQEIALYSTIYIPINNFGITAGARTSTIHMEDSIYNKHATTYQIGADYDLKFAKPFLNYNTSFRNPSLDELYAPYYGNLDLKAEYGKSINGGVDAYISNNGFLQFYGFYTVLEDSIMYDFKTEKYFNSMGENTAKGYNVLLNQGLGNFEVFVGYAKAITNNQTTGKRIAYYPEDTANFGVNYFYGKNTLSISANYNGGMVDSNNNKVQNYTLVSLENSYKVKDNISFYVKINNLENIDYEIEPNYANAKRTFTIGVLVE